ncbi:MAG TPA: hypothetical protein VMR99_02850 [Candidatus Paceibacterota bacterium]|nr:hypothetical protein [Candidatus Paceibacterota bacterium]
MGNIVPGIFQSILVVWGAVWWIVIPIIAIIVFWEAWRLHLHYKFVTNIKWKLLEIKVPKNVLKTPKAMEQIFAAAHAPYSYGIPFSKKYIEGMEEYWMVFELIGRAGETHFYLRVPSQFRHMMESAIYAQYPEAEIDEVDDYLEEFPHVLPNSQFDVSGLEEVLRHENYLPIRTYPMFEESVEERRIDTIAPLMEAMSKLKNDEQLWFQVLIKPTGEDFRQEGEKEVKKLLGIEEQKKPSVWPKLDLGFTASDVLRGAFEHPGEAAPSKPVQQVKQQRFLQTPVDKERAEAIHLKISKIAFEATLRFLYVEKREGAEDSGHTNSIHGFIRQFNTQNLNSLKPNSPTSTASYSVKGLFKKTRIRARKRFLYENYRHFSPAHHESILNIEELATVFHFPLAVVSTTELEKVESRKGSPPASLPIIEE